MRGLNYRIKRAPDRFWRYLLWVRPVTTPVRAKRCLEHAIHLSVRVHSYPAFTWTIERMVGDQFEAWMDNGLGPSPMSLLLSWGEFEIVETEAIIVDEVDEDSPWVEFLNNNPQAN